MITIIAAIILYVLVSIVAIGVLGAENMAGSTSPLQLAADALSTPGIRVVVALGASTAMLGVLLSQILGISRMMLAMGRRKDLLPVLQKIHPRYKVPHLGIFLTGTIILFLSIFGTLEFILAAAAFTILLYYSITNIAALKQPEEDRRFGKAVPLMGLTGCLAMAISLDGVVIISGLLMLLTGLIIRWIIHTIYG